MHDAGSTPASRTITKGYKMKSFVTEISLENYRHTRKWIVDIDCGTEFNYRGRVSSNAFFHSPKKRNYSDTSLYHEKSLEEAVIVSEVLLEYGIEKPIILDEIEQVESIWKFYEIIGYDYKKKRYING
jgi:hypothetical protein